MWQHIQNVASESLPHGSNSAKPLSHDTAAKMFARRAAEVAAAFPASWSSLAKASHSAPKKAEETSSMARNVAYRQHQLHKYLLHRAKETVMKSKLQTKMERDQAAMQGARELDHFEKISEQVFST